MALRRHLELVPHYLAVTLAIVAAVGATRVATGGLGFAVELAVVVVVVLLYPTVARTLGVAPAAWETDEGVEPETDDDIEPGADAER